MSQVAPTPKREPVKIDDRSMTASRRQRIIEERGGVCGRRDCEITDGLEVDHIIALKLGGPDKDTNLQVLCREHHKEKTKRDRKLIAKAERQRRKDNGEWPESQHKLRSRGFAPSRSRMVEMEGDEL